MLSTLALFALPLLASSAPLKRGGDAKFTYYDTSVGLGSCGLLHANSEYTVALNTADWSSYGSGYPNPVCGSEIWITYGSKTVTATIQDMCPGCPSNGLDLSEDLFSALASQDLGVIYGSWGFGSAGSSNEAATTVAAAAAAVTTSAESATPATSATSTATIVTTAAPAAESEAARSNASVEYPWSAIDPSEACVGSQLVLWNETSVIYNGTVSEAGLNSTELSIVEWCFDGVLSGNLTELTSLNVSASSVANGTTAF
ncbi:RlpA-like double-psi beta-barrel domain [Phaffia rhodozyma]|uniref:RlpA-like double-psi beta-barrel domain n=1 Tax=Phaffia rhodozyma TaxID=264483 RepID=A0A0F7SXL3_PHARH|nr:RlpA-like double-psi beta-barrel domain [Phaffia rhodozyma]